MSAVLFFCVSCVTGQVITTVAGTGFLTYSGDGESATLAQIQSPSGVFFDIQRNIFIADTNNHRIRRINGSTGIITTIAGTGFVGFSGDNQLAINAQLNSPNGVFVDSQGNIFIADTNNHRIRRINGSTGIITTIAGTGSGGHNGDNQLAINARLNLPNGVFVDSQGNIFIADTNNHRIRRINAGTGIITTIAGTGTSVDLNLPNGVFVDSQGNIFIADTENHIIRRINAGTGTSTIIAGNINNSGFDGDGQLATEAELSSPSGVFVDSQGNIFIADTNNHRIRRINGGTGIITTIAGTNIFGYNGDNQLATNAQLNQPNGVFVDSQGNIFIADTENNRLRRINATNGIITTIAGTNIFGFNGDNQLAVTAQLNQPNGVFVDSQGNIFIADTRNDRIRRVNSTNGIITTTVGLSNAVSIFGDPQGNIISCSSTSHRVFRINTTSGVSTTIAGTGFAGFSGDNQLAINAQLNSPNGVFVDAQGNIFIADTENHRIRRINLSDRRITTIAGNGTAGFSGDNQLATNAQLNQPRGIFVSGNKILIADTRNHRIRQIDTTNGIITTIAGTGAQGFNGNGQLAFVAQLNLPTTLLIDNNQNIFFVDHGNDRIRLINITTGIITTFAGTGSTVYNGDNQLATNSNLWGPRGIALDSQGNIYVADTFNHRIRMIAVPTASTTSTVTTEVITTSTSNILTTGTTNFIVTGTTNVFSNGTTDFTNSFDTSSTSNFVENNQSTSDQVNNSINSSLIIGITVPIFVLLVILFIILIILVKRRRNKKKYSIESQNRNSITLAPASVELSSIKGNSNLYLKNILIQQKIGSGAFGVVYKGTWNQSTEVALKTISLQQKELEEIAILQKIKHPNIVQFLGLYKQEDEETRLFMVTEYMNKGSLLDILRKSSKDQLTMEGLFSFCKQTCSAMVYLTSEKILHKDLACRNLLCSLPVGITSYDHLSIKVSDFGLSEILDYNQYYSSNTKEFPVRWSAPEVIFQKKFSSKSDVWSFGIVMWEIFSFGREPYYGMNNQTVVEKIEKEGYRLPNPNEQNCPTAAYGLMLECWKEDPKERPTFQQIHDKLNLINYQYNPVKSNYMDQISHSTNQDSNPTDQINKQIYNHTDSPSVQIDENRKSSRALYHAQIPSSNIQDQENNLYSNQ